MSNTSRTEALAALPSALDAHLGYWMRLVSNHVSYTFKTKLERHHVTVAEWVILRALWDEGGVRPSALGETLGLTRGAISKLLDRLLFKQLVEVRADAQDARAQRARLSPRGRRLVPKLAALADENDAETFGHLTETERNALRCMMQQMGQRLGLRGAPVD